MFEQITGMIKLRYVYWVAFILVLVGALHLGVVGLFPEMDLGAQVDKLTGEPLVKRILFILIGVSAIWLAYARWRFVQKRMAKKAEKVVAPVVPVVAKVEVKA